MNKLAHLMKNRSREEQEKLDAANEAAFVIPDNADIPHPGEGEEGEVAPTASAEVTQPVSSAEATSSNSQKEDIRNLIQSVQEEIKNNPETVDEKPAPESETTSGGQTGGETENKASEKPEEEDVLDDKNELFVKCLKAAKSMGYDGEALHHLAKGLYQAEKAKQAAVANDPQAAAQQVAQQQNQQAHRPGTGGGGGGGLGLGALFSRMFTKGTEGAKVPTSKLQNHIINHRIQTLENNYHALGERGEVLDKEVLKLNEILFKGSLGGKALLEMAKEKNIEPTQLVQDIQSGKIDSSQAKVALESAVNNPLHQDQWKKVQAAQSDVIEAAEKTAASFAKLEQSHPGKIDKDDFANKFDKKLETISQGNKPIAGTSEDKNLVEEFQKKMDEMMENMKKIMQKILDRVVKVLGR